MEKKEKCCNKPTSKAECKNEMNECKNEKNNTECCDKEKAPECCKKEEDAECCGKEKDKTAACCTTENGNHPKCDVPKQGGCSADKK